MRQRKANMATILMSGTALILMLILLLVGALTYHSTRLSVQRRFIEQYFRIFNQIDGQLQPVRTAAVPLRAYRRRG